MCTHSSPTAHHTTAHAEVQVDASLTKPTQHALWTTAARREACPQNSKYRCSRLDTMQPTQHVVQWSNTPEQQQDLKLALRQLLSPFRTLLWRITT